jgi:predicted acylesterase/phospholipase RssA
MGCTYSRYYPECGFFGLYEQHYDIDEEYSDEKVILHTKISPIKNIIFEGAATSTAPVFGTYKYLWDNNIIQGATNFAGTSSGSFFASICAVRMDANILINEYIDVEQEDFKDDDFGFVRDFMRLYVDGGYYKGDVYKNWVDKMLEKATGIKNITFAEVNDMYGTNLIINGSNLTKLSNDIYSVETTPTLSVSEAVRRSSSLPIIFQFIKENDGDIIVDGGLGDNYMLEYWDSNNKPNMETLGVKIMTFDETRDEKIKKNLDYKIKNIIDELRAVIDYQFIVNERLKTKLIPKYWERTISVRCPIREIENFELGIKEKKEELERGIQITSQYMEYRSKHGELPQQEDRLTSTMNQTSSD